MKKTDYDEETYYQKVEKDLFDLKKNDYLGIAFSLIDSTGKRYFYPETTRIENPSTWATTRAF